jgi:receptor protein-tyrosine kinase
MGLETLREPRPGAAGAAGTGLDARPAERARVPRAKPLDGNGVDPHLVTLVAPGSFEADQYRLLGHSLDEARRTRGLKSVALTSPAPGDGKTLTSINLAGALAQGTARRVLLVDADLRCPAVAERLGIVDAGPGLAGACQEPERGLASLLRRRGSLSVLPAGPRPQLPYEALRSAAVAELMRQARESFDLIVLDAPPLLPVPDCRALEELVDGFLLVIAAHRTPRQLVQEALNASHPAKLLGLVYNGDDDVSSLYRKYYDKSRNGDAPSHAGRHARNTRAGNGGAGTQLGDWEWL